jgi:hypothetical protein
VLKVTTPWHQNPKVRHHVHKNPPPVPNWASWIHYAPTPNLHKILSDPMLSSTSQSCFGLSHQTFVHFPLLPHACHMARPPHSPLFNLPNDIWEWVHIMKLLIVQLHSPATSSFWGPNILLRTMVSSTLSLMLFPYCDRPGFTPKSNSELWFTMYVRC